MSARTIEATHAVAPEAFNVPVQDVALSDVLTVRYAFGAPRRLHVVGEPQRVTVRGVFVDVQEGERRFGVYLRLAR